jgi:hypothetical protein
LPEGRGLWYDHPRWIAGLDARSGPMQADHFNNTLVAFKRRTPFRPFTVALVNGDRFEVDYPDALVVRDGVAIYIKPGGVPVIFDHEGVNQVIGDLMGEANPQ